jgi:hypothetical protein
LATLGAISGSTTLNVTPATLQSITITPDNPTAPVGETSQLTATGTYSDGTTQDITSSVVWSSSATSNATVSDTGLVTAIAVGSLSITATSGSVSQAVSFTVTPAINLELPLGETWAVTCYAINEEPINPGGPCIWTYAGAVSSSAGSIEFTPNPPSTYPASDALGNLAIATTSITGSSGPYSYTYTLPGSVADNGGDLTASSTQHYQFLISSQTASTATVVVNASTSIGDPIPNTLDVFTSVGVNCQDAGLLISEQTLNCKNLLQSNSCPVTQIACNTSASWTNKIISVPTNTPILVYTFATSESLGPSYCGLGKNGPSCPSELTWALANVLIDIDPAFLAIDPDAQIFFSPGVDQTGPSTLPTGGQP